MHRWRWRKKIPRIFLWIFWALKKKHVWPTDLARLDQFVTQKQKQKMTNPFKSTKAHCKPFEASININISISNEVAQKIPSIGGATAAIGGFHKVSNRATCATGAKDIHTWAPKAGGFLSHGSPIAGLFFFMEHASINGRFGGVSQFYETSIWSEALI